MAAVAIGRNEGTRLLACLDSLTGAFGRVVYVDSGSTDGSVGAARARGVDVVELDLSRPFSAARARNAGVARLAETGLPEVVQFIDGDCVLASDWPHRMRAAFAEMQDVGILAGRLAERDPEASIYAHMAQQEWRRPAGDVEACGGIMAVRGAVLGQTGGFDEAVIAAEDDEFCIRARAAGWRVHRLDHAMATHDIGMTTFRQWWKRMERTGHGYAQVGYLHPGYFRAARSRAVAYGLALPLALVAALAARLPVVAAVALGAYGLSWARTARGLRREGASPERARQHAGFLTLSKIPCMIGMARFHWRRLTGRPIGLIEYK